MKIQILGTGCPKCQKLYENVQDAVAESGAQAEIIKVTDLKEISSYGVMVTPALAIDGVVKILGKVPLVDEIFDWLA
ncbi:MAG: TM0996/MTH895 family glutaredoxin-like protein [Candidatus Omnitrophica bacterium]|nr:TM0996/MTH895 family glutaredoxin-like protein [Candidatus Omnitrophota bacterium]MBU1128017.1 TM0996/MTH895 family glutaredoxin-like protein [Candidatus Omnitrophota bacterium]MBU1657417.1 TM0996/MTH895 family glutaredoxin-like protein [Candidatus Omnitrophota bacterium]MBU1784807.1 TM0996/MTH895 family glutaredoxin-like protein [Candidatus Omnitrophota bacterium]MBU1850880.1 TM0996/MTH895 family glutaredoxin-like protein [Candidatus Omnitrophota bacterium]